MNDDKSAKITQHICTCKLACVSMLLDLILVKHFRMRRDRKQNFINICKISFNKRYLLHTYICYYPIATFQKAGTCLDAQQSMAKQPIKGCVSNHSRTCGKSVSE